MFVAAFVAGPHPYDMAAACVSSWAQRAGFDGPAHPGRSDVAASLMGPADSSLPAGPDA